MNDFVTYEVGKKLKEKGYSHDYNLFGYLPIYSDERIIKLISDIGAYEQEYYGENIPCPTISQVLKWLREEKQIYLELVVVVDGEYMCDIYKIDIRPIECLGSTEYSKTYEEAALAGIEYVLDNLI